MTQEALYGTLQKILLLEESQVVFYSTLASKAPNEEMVQGLQRLSAVEKEHVVNIQTKIAQLFPEKESSLLSLKDNVTDMGLSLFGSTVGITQEIAGLVNLLKAGAAAEQKAIGDYKKLLGQIQIPELREMLWGHLIDEELHYLWLQKRIKEMDTH